MPATPRAPATSGAQQNAATTAATTSGSGGSGGSAAGTPATRGAPATRNAPAPPLAPSAPAARENRPVMVSGDKVQRRSGTLPQLEAAKRGELPDRIKALLCIDTRGAVTSVKLYDKLRAPVRVELEQALRAWRYVPYQENGKAVDACFGIVFRTVLH
jgi:hypothetical protein